MERLTRKNWQNLDPWEKCGQDNFCKRGCHEQGGCTKGCIVPRIYDRLAAYENLMERWKLRSIEEADRIFHRVNALGGIDLMAQYRDIGSIDHFRDLLQAEQEGRLVVLDEKTALCMCAGARAIENNKRLFGASYCYDVFGKRGGPKEISYYEASNHLRDVAEPVLDREEAEAALEKEGGTHEDTGGL